MPFVPVPDTIQVEVRGLLNGQAVENTFYYLAPSAPDAALIQAVADAAADYVEAEIAVFSTAFFFTEVYARDLSDSTFLSALAFPSTPVTGAFTDPDPNNVTFALKRSSGFSGRSARGRIFWMGITDSMRSNDNNIAGAVADGMVDFLEGLDAAVEAEGVTAVIVSRFNGGAPRVTGVTYPLVTWSYSDNRVDTMKGRLP